MEATGIYHLLLAKFLFKNGFSVIVTNPIRTHHFAKLKMIVKLLKLAVKQLERQIDIIEMGVKDLIKTNADLNKQIELLKTIDGIGDKTAWSLLAYAGDMSEFDNANQITSFVGLNPKQKQSGNSMSGSSLSKTGHRKLRKSLYMPATGCYST